jgi:hypothetical protein
MSTTIRPVQLLAALPVIFLAWIALMALVMRFGEAPAALVLLPPPGFLRALPDEVTVSARGPWSVTLQGGSVAGLYAAGALLVLPAGLTGCLPQGAS